MLLPQEFNLSHLYLSPLEKCNLNCKLCYTRKTKERLSQETLFDFIKRYQQYLTKIEQSLQTITLCGGEVFLLPWLNVFANRLNQQNIIVEIITNGILDRLAEFTQPNLINLLISIDGLPKFHDSNRGQGQFSKTWQFLRRALELNFHCEIFSVISQKNFDQINQFEQYLQKKLGFLPRITYHPRKPLTYLNYHPAAKNLTQTKTRNNEFGFLNAKQFAQIAQNKKIFPPVNLGCHQLAVMSDGMVYACCEGVRPVGEISTPIADLVQVYQQRVKIPLGFTAQFCHGCAESDFVCGLSQIYAKIAGNSNEK